MSSSTNATRVVEDNGLFRDEHLWREHYTWLESEGYRLRPRYQPNWTPSWLRTKKDPDKCEDGRSPLYTTVLDAKRIEDGRIVAIKRLSKARHPMEVAIVQSLSRPPLDKDPANHCVPILGALQSPRDADVVFLIMPYLIQHEKIPFVTVGEVAELFRQLLEGLRFIHTRNVAHRDIMTSNIMMEPAVYSDTPHPMFRSKNYEFTGKVKLRTRTECPVKYYYTDFGISCQISAETKRPREPPVLGGDRSVPEHQKLDEPRDPYRTDMYCLGNVIRMQFIQRYSSFDFLAPLVNEMVRDDPAERPDITSVCDHFDAMLDSTPPRRLRSRLVPRGENIIAGFFRACRHAVRTAAYCIGRKAALPTPNTSEPVQKAKTSAKKQPQAKDRRTRAPPSNLVPTSSSPASQSTARLVGNTSKKRTVGHSQPTIPVTHQMPAPAGKYKKAPKPKLTIQTGRTHLVCLPVTVAVV
ncbi:kinase-like domain-containing protein [Trametes gibbosa]|nr:kinase-like domain-containing protein [Trametes gibbosa]